MSEKDNKSDEAKNTIFGIPLYNNNNEEQANNNLLGIPTFTAEKNYNNGVGFEDANHNNIKNLVFQLENAIRSNNMDTHTFEIYRQAIQLATFDNIIENSTIINAAALTNLQEKARDFERKNLNPQVLNDQDPKIANQQIKEKDDAIENNLETNKDNNKKSLLSISYEEEKNYRLGFLQERNNYQKSLEESQQNFKESLIDQSNSQNQNNKI